MAGGRLPEGREAFQWKTGVGQLLNLIFPPRCACCGDFGSLLCPECADGLEPLGGLRCPRCGRPEAAVSKGGWCADCVDRTLNFASARSAYYYSGVGRDVVAHLKYGGERGLAEVMARAAYPEFRRLLAELAPPVVVTWVPSHPSTVRERGFNQACLLARGLVQLVGGPVEALELVVKKRRTEHQQALSREERQANLRASFYASTSPSLAAKMARIAPRSLVLVDDVYTTGATASEVAGVAGQAWGLPVHVFTFARAMQQVGDFRD